MICNGCEEEEHDCCNNLITPGACSCSCEMVLLPIPRLNVFMANKPPLPHELKRRCIHGHALTGGNVYFNKKERRCKTCRQVAWRAYRRRQGTREETA